MLECTQARCACDFPIVTSLVCAEHRSGGVELLPDDVDDGDHLVHVRRRRQVLGEDEEVSAQHEGGGAARGQVALQAQWQQKSKLATTVSESPSVDYKPR